MKIVEISLVDKDFNLEDRKALSKKLDEELALFDKWMIDNLGGRLTKFERAIVKTYLYHKLVGRIDDLDRKPINLNQ